MTLFDIRNGLAPISNGFEEIEHVDTDRRSDVPFKVFFDFVLWVLVEFEFDVAVDGFGIAATRNEIVALYAQFECTFIAV